jgi:enamine deaminase RidA (YjgF/YER057c/UK114 family)
MERQEISTGEGMPPTGPFVQAIKVGNFLLYEENFGKDFPTRTIVEVSRLNGDDNIEVTASIAYIP